MPLPIINIADLTTQPMPEGMGPTGDACQKYGAQMAFIGPVLGAKKLGYNLTEVEPGKSAFPYHCHRVNEEMFYILEGEGRLRLGENHQPIKAGDIIACPPGGPETAHQIINTGANVLRFLAVSTRLTPELAEYPDSGKFGVMAQYSDADGKPEMFLHVGKREQNLPYWD
ncbi:cupin domain-containing protein [Gilvimarinus agarilyticus]|uniref:cupin domain-containing protein n=1 Tax=Gilvimarinus sp. 2_MG-2023 TaxID=3062666 RepID=UPI001C091799|nr:cupin domain-containing protein [Gilvimarinus sp. 2_MG-2023]MBU2887540.1 cupin domain-containing protein [Gilvimarinus agarilyticus]MDO6572191.1 cupin domain-containing protein [Gilvimarinus sp. 2_MG-2023]